MIECAVTGAIENPMKRQTVFICLALGILVACNPYPNVNIGNGGLLSGESCGPPCFWNITPGLSGEMGARSALAERGATAACHDWDFRPNGTRGIDCAFPGKGIDHSLGRISIGLDSNTDAVTYVAFGGAEPIALRDVIEKYGPPSWVAVWSSGTPERVTVDAILFFDTIPARLDFPSQQGSNFVVQPDAFISDVSYLSPQWYAIRVQELSELMQRWRGFGTYSAQ